jgi:2,3-bisphosphoglycerate-dependent phosphoglycerate mutase
MILYFVRHAQSQNNALNNDTDPSSNRQPDPQLTPIGHQQAEILANFLTSAKEPEFAFSHLYTSLMLRAIQTGEILSRHLRIPLIAWPEIHETGGVYQKNSVSGERIGLPGNSRTYFEANYPSLHLPEEMNNDGWWNRPYENQVETVIRAQTVLNKLQKNHGSTSDVVIFISHGGFFNYFINALVHKTSREHYWFSMNNAAVSSIYFYADDRIVFRFMNRTDFLPSNLIT